jgi:RhtB (resistance to homoserine/threonine) family protein
VNINLVGFFVVVMLAYVIPGPDFLIIARSAARGRRAGQYAALGTQAGLCVHMLLAALGLSALAAHSAVAFSVLKLAGACYLAWLGARIVRSSRGTTPAATDNSGDKAAAPANDKAGQHPWHHFRQGLLTNLFNPKAALFFLSVLPQFVNTSAPAAPQIFLLGVIDVLLGVVYWVALVLLIRRLSTQLCRPAVRAWWDRLTGSLLVGAGATLVTTD